MELLGKYEENSHILSNINKLAIKGLETTYFIWECSSFSSPYFVCQHQLNPFNTKNIFLDLDKKAVLFHPRLKQ